MAKTTFVFLFFFFLFGPGIFPQNQPKNVPEEEDIREEILEKAAEYCEKLKRVVFHFVCHENIREKVFLYKTKRTITTVEATGEPLLTSVLKFKRTKTRTYLYDY